MSLMICEECGLPIIICNALAFYRKGMKEDGDAEYKRYMQERALEETKSR